MKDNTEDIDRLIKNALTEEEAKFYDELDEQTFFGMLGGVFTGKLKWLLILMNSVTVFAFIGLIYCIMQFVDTDVTNELIKWGILGMFFMLMMSMIKLFVWLQMDKNALLREIKRIELQLAALSSKLP
ncbi:MAG: DUF6768 family protein [Flavobacteriaceae bacterium]